MSLENQIGKLVEAIDKLSAKLDGASKCKCSPPSQADQPMISTTIAPAPPAVTAPAPPAITAPAPPAVTAPAPPAATVPAPPVVKDEKPKKITKARAEKINNLLVTTAQNLGDDAPVRQLLAEAGVASPVDLTKELADTLEKKLKEL